MSQTSSDARPVEIRHDLAHVPLASPARTSGVLEVFRRRHLLRLMVRREIQARYAGTAFGLAWSGAAREALRDLFRKHNVPISVELDQGR